MTFIETTEIVLFFVFCFFLLIIVMQNHKTKQASTCKVCNKTLTQYEIFHGCFYCAQASRCFPFEVPEGYAAIRVRDLQEGDIFQKDNVHFIVTDKNENEITYAVKMNIFNRSKPNRQVHRAVMGSNSMQIVLKYIV